MASVDNVLLEMERRGHDFFDDTMRIGRVMDLLNRSRVQEASSARWSPTRRSRSSERVNELIDWLVDADFRQWQRITRHLADRRRAFRDRIVGQQQDDEESRRSTTSGGAWSRRSAARRRPSSRPTIAGAKRASSPMARETPSPPRRGRRGRARPRHARHDRREHGRGRRHRHPARQRRRRPRVLHHPGQAQPGEGGDAGEDRRRPRPAVDGAARAVPGGDRPQHRRGCAKASPPTAASCARKRRSCRRPTRAWSQLKSDLDRVRHASTRGGVVGGRGFGGRGFRGLRIGGEVPAPPTPDPRTLPAIPVV